MGPDSPECATYRPYMFWASTTGSSTAVRLSEVGGQAGAATTPVAGGARLQRLEARGLPAELDGDSVGERAGSQR